MLPFATTLLLLSGYVSASLNLNTSYSYRNFSSLGTGPMKKLATVKSYPSLSSNNYFDIKPNSIKLEGGIVPASYSSSNSSTPILYYSAQTYYPFKLRNENVPIHSKTRERVCLCEYVYASFY
jgi:hypothetical protein